MSKRLKNDERVTARISTSVKETLQQAADLSGATLNQFLVQSALKEAQRILEAERTIVLSQQDANKIFALIENPPIVRDKLKAAFEKHEQFFREDR
ncbi:MAG: DUF1778 domain-containing protein [Hydrococcus sp. Prado102]|jgi:uncharacterized protein (DUF1778 family)|nr:DUF1778 domain-containing protein [Hydrococcus sp. Prado102]